MNNIPPDKVGLGSTVKVYDSAKEVKIEYHIVTTEESDIGQWKDFDQLGNSGEPCSTKR